MRGNPDALMLFAAGLGTRMGNLTANRPKPLIPVAGRPLIDRALDLAKAMKVHRIVVNMHHKAELLLAHLAGRDVIHSVEQPDILDTGGGMKAAIPLLSCEVAYTLNCDSIFAGPNPLAFLADHWDAERMDGLLLLVCPDQARGHRGTGDFTLDTSGLLQRGGPLIYIGAQILKSKTVASIPERVFSLNRVWDAQIQLARLHGVLYPGQWCDVGHPAGILAAEAMLTEVGDA